MLDHLLHLVIAHYFGPTMAYSDLAVESVRQVVADELALREAKVISQVVSEIEEFQQAA